VRATRGNEINKSQSCPSSGSCQKGGEDFQPYYIPVLSGLLDASHTLTLRYIAAARLRRAGRAQASVLSGAAVVSCFLPGRLPSGVLEPTGQPTRCLAGRYEPVPGRTDGLDAACLTQPPDVLLGDRSPVLSCQLGEFSCGIDGLFAHYKPRLPSQPDLIIPRSAFNCQVRRPRAQSVGKGFFFCYNRQSTTINHRPSSRWPGLRVEACRPASLGQGSAVCRSRGFKPCWSPSRRTPR
jgi:hypothetical protein